MQGARKRDKRCKLIRKLAVTHAAVSDSTIFEVLLDHSNTSRDVYADRGYPSAEREQTLTAEGWRVQIQRKGSATCRISDTQKQRNRRIPTPCAGVEHVFGALAQMGAKLVRCRGIVRVDAQFASESGRLQFKAFRVLDRIGAKTVLSAAFRSMPKAQPCPIACGA